MTNPFHLPLNRWPLATHVLLAVLIVGVVAAAARFSVHRADAVLATRDTEVRGLQSQLDGLRRTPTSAPAPDFSQTLPASSRADDVVRDIGRFAQANAVVVTSIGVEPRAASSTELGKVTFSIAATADYRTTKAMMAELLARYPTLGMQSLSMRPLPNDPTRLDVRLVLVLVTRD